MTNKTDKINIGLSIDRQFYNEINEFITERNRAHEVPMNRAQLLKISITRYMKEENNE